MTKQLADPCITWAMNLTPVLGLKSKNIAFMLQECWKTFFCLKKLSWLNLCRECRENLKIRSLRIQFRIKSALKDSPQLVGHIHTVYIVNVLIVQQQHLHFLFLSKPGNPLYKSKEHNCRLRTHHQPLLLSTLGVNSRFIPALLIHWGVCYGDYPPRWSSTLRYTK